MGVALRSSSWSRGWRTSSVAVAQPALSTVRGAWRSAYHPLSSTWNLAPGLGMGSICVTHKGSCVRQGLEPLRSLGRSGVLGLHSIPKGEAVV